MFLNRVYNGDSVDSYFNYIKIFLLDLLLYTLKIGMINLEVIKRG